jgi:O-antigen/teichoic acid export membrane protein
MTYCIWYGLLPLGLNYIWCSERSKLAALPLAAGLVANIGINIALIPAYGLLVAVISTTLATGLGLAVLYCINHCTGMKIQPGLIWLSIAPGAMCGGALCGTAVLVVLASILPFSKTLFTPTERSLLIGFARDWIGRLASYRSAKIEQAEPSHAV